MKSYIDQALETHKRPPGSPVMWRIGVYALIESDGCVLLVDQIVAAGPGLSLPGGGVELEPEETVLEGSVREVHEETGYHFTPDPNTVAIIGDHFIRSPSGNHYHAISFLVRGTVADRPDPAWRRNNEEIIEARWVDPATLTRTEIRQLHWDTLIDLGYVEEA